MNKLFVLSVALLLTSCSSIPIQDYWSATGGSRADGSVTLTRDYKEWGNNIDLGGIKLAKDKCSLWGYTDAKLFGRPVLSCTQYVQGFFGPTSTCATKYIAKATYQCIGKPDK